MSGVHILGSGGSSDKEQEADDDHKQDSRRVNVTNFLSLGHLIPWGGVLDVKRLSPTEVKERLKDKRIDLFVCPDMELMGEIFQHEALTTGHMPQGTPEEREAGFCQMIEAAVKQMSGCHVRRTQKPKPAGADRKTFYIQFFAQQVSGVVGGGLTLGSVWWEMVTKELRQKPEAVPAKATESGVVSS